LLMNSLYGRMMYRTKHGRAWTCKTLKSLQQYIESHYVTDFQIKDDGSVFISGVDRRAPQKLEVPVHLGCFVLAYSKILMLDFYNTVSPGLKSAEVFYTDNDSVFVTGRSVGLLDEKGLLIPDSVDKYDSAEMFKHLGKGKNDIKDGLMIVKAKFLGPKQYYYTYLSHSGKLCTRLVTAGIPGVWINQGQNKDLVLNEYFEKMNPITIENASGERLFTPNYWGGMRMNLLGDWYPSGYFVEN